MHRSPQALRPRRRRPPPRNPIDPIDLVARRHPSRTISWPCRRHLAPTRAKALVVHARADLLLAVRWGCSPFPWSHRRPVILLASFRMVMRRRTSRKKRSIRPLGNLGGPPAKKPGGWVALILGALVVVNLYVFVWDKQTSVGAIKREADRATPAD